MRAADIAISAWSRLFAVGMVQPVTFWTESGGGGKTTLAVNTAHAIQDAGYDVLVFDMDRQRGSITDHLGYTEMLADDQYNAIDAIFADGRTLRDVILRAETHATLPYDLIPGTFGWNDFGQRASNAAIANPWMIVRNALVDANIPTEYDVIIIDAEGGTDDRQINAIVATQNVIVPVLPNRKGRGNAARARDFVIESVQPAMQRAGVDLDLGVLAVVPTRVRDKNVHERTIRQLQAAEFPTPPFVFRSRGPAEDALDRQQTVFQYAENDDTRDLYDYEPEILQKFRELGRIITEGTVTAARDPTQYPVEV